MPEVRRPGGITLHFTDAGAGTPLLLHTGSAGDATMWERAGYHALLGARRLVAMDHRGHGASSTPADVTGFAPSELVADVLAVLDEAHVDRAVLVGYSAGAAVLCRTASEHPDRCLGFVGIGFCPAPPDGQLSPWPDLVRQRGVPTILDEMALRESAPPPGWLLENLRVTPDPVFVGPIEAAVGARPLWDAFCDLDSPALLVVGAEEVDATGLAAAVASGADVTAVRLDGYGHLQVFWHAEATGAAIADWLGARGW